MTDERLNDFDDLTPCPAPPRLRAGVLAAVDRRLSESSFMPPGVTAGLSDPTVLMPSATAGLPDPQVLMPGATAGSSSSVLPVSACTYSSPPHLSLEKLSACTVAAALLIGIGLCAWQRQVVDARLAATFGPAPVSTTITELVRDVESTSGPGTGRWLSERLLASKSRHERPHRPGEPITTYPLSTLP
jgi:hypothetical protein